MAPPFSHARQSTTIGSRGYFFHFLRTNHALRGYLVRKPDKSQSHPLQFRLVFVGLPLHRPAAGRNFSAPLEFGCGAQPQTIRCLERLSHDIITSVPEEDRLPRLLARHIPGMFPSGDLIVWRFPDEVLFHQRADWNVDLDQIWPWLAGQSGSSSFMPNEHLPWDDKHHHENPILITPVLTNSQPIGAVYLSLHDHIPWNRNAVERLILATESLAALIASAFAQSQAYVTDIRLERVSQELRLAGEIQSSLIPLEIPSVAGWQISVTLNPAGETYGDFFDLIPLPDGKLG